MEPDALTVLIVDDEDLVRMIGADILEEAGYRVIEAASAAEAIGRLEQANEVQVLFTDINMPGTPDGLGLAKLVHDRWPSVKILVSSGAVRPARSDIPDDGKFLSKPYRRDQLLALIRALATPN